MYLFGFSGRSRRFPSRYCLFSCQQVADFLHDERKRSAIKLTSLGTSLVPAATGGYI